MTGEKRNTPRVDLDLSKLFMDMDVEKRKSYPVASEPYVMEACLYQFGFKAPPGPGPEEGMVAQYVFSSGYLPAGWTVTEGVYRNHDGYFRDCMSNWDPHQLLVVTGPAPLAAGSDWSIQLTANGKLPEQCGYGVQVVSDGGGIPGLGWYGESGSPPKFFGGGGWGSSYETSGDPNWYTWTITHDSTQSAFYVDGTLVSTWPGVGIASTGGPIVITVPNDGAIRTVRIYDRAISGF